MSVFVLVHGVSHGAWCWFKVKPVLEQFGHTVVCPDLPAHGLDRTPLSDVSLAKYSDAICDVVENQSEPAILVGHSLGGVVISEVANRLPEAIECLVYLSAFLLRPNQSIHQVIADDSDSQIPTGFDFNNDGTVAMPKLSAVSELFYNDCAPEFVALAQSLLVPIAVGPHDESLMRTNKNIPRVYIECTLDRAITPIAQRRMQADMRCERVVKIDAGHSPFFSVPDVLGAKLHSLITNDAESA